jgi:ABC-2 type transport system permease protein
VIAGLALIGWALVQNGQALSAGGVALAVALLVAGGLILYSLWFLLAGLSIWFVKVWNATEVLRYTLVAGRYPISAYPPALRVVFTLVLPVAFLTTVPAEALLGRASAAWALGSLAAAAISLVGTRLFWQFALRHYTSASS